MKTMKLRREESEPRFDYQHDVERIVRVLASQGYYVSESDARAAWDRYSDMFAAGWLMLPESDDELARAVLGSLEEDT